MPQQSTIGFLASPSARWTGNASGCSRAEKFCSFGTFGPIGDNPIGVEFGFFALGIELFFGPGANGRVVSSPAGIDCDSASNCFNQTVEFPVGTPVKLTPMPASGSSFQMFEQSTNTDTTTCVDTPTCTITNYDRYGIKAFFQTP